MFFIKQMNQVLYTILITYTIRDFTYLYQSATKDALIASYRDGLSNVRSLMTLGY